MALVAIAAIASGASAAEVADSQGRDFWLGFISNQQPNKQTLSISGEEAASGTVAIPGLAFSASFSVTPGTAASVPLPDGAEFRTYDAVEAKGIHVTADKEVSVSGLTRETQTSGTADAFLGLPTDVQGIEYRVLGFGTGFFGGSEFAVVATDDATVVEITPSVNATGSHAAGIPYQVSIDKGEGYQLAAEFGEDDLSGSLITSNKPVAVFGGHLLAKIPDGDTEFPDHIAEQLPPTRAWGKSFMTVPLATRRNGDTFRVLASKNGTIVKINGSTVATLAAGALHQQILTAPASITASEPVLVAQYSNGGDFDDPQVKADPFMMLVPATDQMLDRYTVYSWGSEIGFGFEENYINLVVPNSQVGVVAVDGTPVPAADYTPIASSGFSGAQYSLQDEPGAHRLTGTQPFGAFLYGFSTDSFEAYGQPAGMTFTLDTTPPDTAIDSGPSGVTNDSTPTFGFSSTEPGSTFECRVDSASFASCASPHTTAALSDGQHSFEVRATDLPGNTDPTPASRTFTVDSTLPPSFSIDDVAKSEGNAGTTGFSFKVTLSAPAPAGGVAVGYSTADGSATAGSDFVLRTGQLSFASGETEKAITVNVNGDTVVEPNEDFSVNLSNPTNGATIADAQGKGTIQNDDVPLLSLSINDVARLEGNIGTTGFTFKVTLSTPAPAGGVRVNYTSLDGSASQFSDYIATAGDVTFTAGQTEKTIKVFVRGDLGVELSEYFSVRLFGPVGATISDNEGKGTIQNDDVPPPSLSIDDVAKSEGNAGTTGFSFKVTLSAPAPAGGVAVGYSTANGSATAGSDFVLRTGQLSFASGESEKAITVNVNGDTDGELNEDFFVNLSNPANGATIADAQGKGTIQNDDLVPELIVIVDPVIAFRPHGCRARFCVLVPRTTFISRRGIFDSWSIGYFNPNSKTSARRPTLRVPARAQDCRIDVDVSLSERSYARFDSRLKRSLFNDPSYRPPEVIASRRHGTGKRSGNLTLARAQLNVRAKSQERIRLRATRKGLRLIRGSFKRHRRGTLKATLRAGLVCNGSNGLAIGKRTIRLKLKRPGRAHRAQARSDAGRASDVPGIGRGSSW